MTVFETEFPIAPVTHPAGAGRLLEGRVAELEEWLTDTRRLLESMRGSVQFAVQSATDAVRRVGADEQMVSVARYQADSMDRAKRISQVERMLFEKVEKDKAEKRKADKQRKQTDEQVDRIMKYYDDRLQIVEGEIVVLRTDLAAAANVIAALRGRIATLESAAQRRPQPSVWRWLTERVE